MAKHMVKCLYCQESFDINAEPFAKPRSNRYAHTKCYEQYEAHLSQEDKDYEALTNYIKSLFHELNPRVVKQIKEYKSEYGYSYSGMLKTLKWWYEIKKNSVDKAQGGIGIIPYIYKQACEYYYALYLAATLNEDIAIKSPDMKIREIVISPPQGRSKTVRLFNLDDDDEEEDI